MTTPHYLPADQFEALIARLAEHRLDPFTGKPDRHAIIQALGEIAGVWPDAVKQNNVTQSGRK